MSEQRRTFKLPGQDKGGLVCPVCACRDFRVANTYPFSDSGTKLRRRQCRNCGKIVTTQETLVSDGE